MDFQVPLSEILRLIPLALFLIAAVYALLGIYTLRQESRGRMSSYLAWMMLAMAWWSAGYGMEVSSPTLAAKIFWEHIQIPAAAFAPVFWLFFSMEFMGESALLTFRNKALAVFLPVFTVLAEWTNAVHHLYFSNVQIEITGGLALLKVGFAPLFFIYLGYSYLLLGISGVLLLVQSFRKYSLFRAQTVTMLLAVLPPWIASAFYVFNLFPIPNLNITPFAFIPTAIILTWAITRYKLLEVVPLQQDEILQGLQEGILLLDARRRVLYMNHAAEEMLSVNAVQSLGQPADMACGKYAPLFLHLLGKEELRTELTLEEKGASRYVEVCVTPNYFSEKERRAETPSYRLVFNDVTQRQQAQDALKCREAIMQSVTLASGLFLKSAAWEKNIPAVLERLGQAAEVSRVHIFERRVSENGVPLISQRYEWTRAGIEARIENPDLQNFDWISAGFARWEETLQKRGVISGRVREFPEAERMLLSQQDILSVVATPVFVDNNLWGFVGFDECQSERTWSEAELEALQAAADIFGAALTRGNVERRFLNRQRSQNLLREILRVALRFGEIHEMARFLVDHLGSLIESDHCFLGLWDETRGRIVPTAAYGVKEELYLNMTVETGEKTLTASALEAGHSLVVEDAYHSPYVSPRMTELFGTQSVLVIPMIADGKKLGAVLLGFIEPHRFTTEEILLSEQAADLVALALAKFQAVEEAHRRAEEAETLRRAGVAISETLNLQESTTRILEQLAFVLPHDSASVQLLRGGELEIIGGEGWKNPSEILGVRFPIHSDNPNSIVIQTRQPFLVGDTYESFPVFRETPHSAHIRSWLGVPLIVHNQIIGLLAIDSRSPNRFTPDDAELAATFAAQVAIAIENARLFDEVERLAVTDGLTGLYNRRHFMKLAQIEFVRAGRYRRELAAMLFDIDNFKQVNDRFGHPVGDQVLALVAQTCQAELREADLICRYGGEEFIAFLVETAPSAAKKVGERLRQKVESLKIPTEKGEVSVTISVGIAGLNELTPNLDTLINRADQAMYIAKHKGRNRVVMGK